MWRVSDVPFKTLNATTLADFATYGQKNKLIQIRRCALPLFDPGVSKGTARKFEIDITHWRTGSKPPATFARGAVAGSLFAIRATTYCDDLRGADNLRRRCTTAPQRRTCLWLNRGSSLLSEVIVLKRVIPAILTASAW